MSDQQQDAPEVSRWRYVGDVERLYMSVPVTVQPGAVIEHAGRPADDGWWEAAGESEVTHLPDNEVEPIAWPADVAARAADADEDDGGQQQFQFTDDEHHTSTGE